ncbi:MAG: phosphoenolpyruvate carboxykinase (ATP), partial [Oscillospiraceae bacterium]
IPNAAIPSIGTTPKAVIFLTADAFGVLPPISKLNKTAAMYHFVSGYTSKLAGTERGITEPQATFSTCFGEPFLPLDPNKYAHMLGEKIEKSGASVYLINTGWSGGAYGVGSRMKLSYTRSMVTAALNGELNNVEYELDPIFNVSVPKTCPNVPTEILKPENVWKDKADYKKTALHLAEMFNKNFTKYKTMTDDIIAAGPKAK